MELISHAISGLVCQCMWLGRVRVCVCTLSKLNFSCQNLNDRMILEPQCLSQPGKIECLKNKNKIEHFDDKLGLLAQ